MLQKRNKLGLFFIGLFMSLSSVLASADEKKGILSLFTKASEKLNSFNSSVELQYIFYFVLILLMLHFVFDSLLKKVFSSHSAFKDSVNKSTKIAWLLAIPSTVAFFYPYNAIDKFVLLLNFFFSKLIILIGTSFFVGWAIKNFKNKKKTSISEINTAKLVLVSVIFVFMLINQVFFSFLIGQVGGCEIVMQSGLGFSALMQDASAEIQTPKVSCSYEDGWQWFPALIIDFYNLILFVLIFWMLGLFGKFFTGAKNALKDEEEVAEVQELKTLIGEINKSVQKIDDYLKWVKEFFNRRNKMR